MTATPRRTYFHIKNLLAILATLSFVSEATVNLLGIDQQSPTATATDSTFTSIIIFPVPPSVQMWKLFGDDPYPYTSQSQLNQQRPRWILSQSTDMLFTLRKDISPLLSPPPLYPVRAVMVLYGSTDSKRFYDIYLQSNDPSYWSLASASDIPTNQLSLTSQSGIITSTITTELTSASNFVWDLNGQVIQDLRSFELNINTQGEPLQGNKIQIDKLLAIRESNLNSVFEPYKTWKFMDVRLIPWKYSPNTHFIQTVIDMITAPRFTDASYPGDLVHGCHVFDSGQQFDAGYGELRYLSSWLIQPDEAALGIPTVPLGLISSVFFKMGPENGDHFKFQIYPIIWNNSTKDWDISTSPVVLVDSSALGRKTGNYIVDLTQTTLSELAGFNSEPFVAAAAEFNFLTTSSRQVCNVQFFGWYYCQIVSLSAVKDLRFNPGETKDIYIGNLTAYYDPDLKKENNPFCSWGIERTFLKWSIFQGRLQVQGFLNALYLGPEYPPQFKIDPETLAVYLLDFKSPSDDVGSKFLLQVDFSPDDKSLRNGLNQIWIQGGLSAEIPGEICNCCNICALQLATTALASGTPIPDPIDYIVGSVLYMSLGVFASCEGFTGGTITMTDSDLAPISMVTQDFTKCQSESPAPVLCAYIDSETKVLAFFSKHALDTPVTLTYNLFTVYTGIDSSDKPVATNQIATVISVLITPSRSQSEAKKHIYSTYYIGIVNPALNLKQYYVSLDGFPLAEIQINQTEGTLSSQFYSINNKNWNFVIDFNDQSYDGKTSVFNSCAYAANRKSNCSLVLTVSFKTATSEQMFAKNTAPVFQDNLAIPDRIPCFSTNDALIWSYSFPEAFDSENGSIKFEMDCGTTDSQTFTQKMNENFFTLNLNTTMDDLQAENFECAVKLSDPFAASSIYVVEFKSVCYKFDQNSTFVTPLPTIRNIDSSGEVLIQWNVQMRVPGANHRLLKDISDQNECLNVQIVPGSGSIFSQARNMSFSYNVSDFKPTSTTLQLVFGTPSAISTEQIADQLVVVFPDSGCFTSVQGVRLNKTSSLRRKIPRQKTGGIMQIPESVKTLVSVATYAIVFVLVISFVLQGLFNEVLSSIVSLSVIFHMFLVNLNYPLEMMDFFALLFPLITFDAIPVAKIYERMFHFSTITTDYALTDQFDNSGYSSLFLVNNIGSIFFIAMFQLAISILLWFVRRIRLFSRLKRVQNKLDTVASNTLWNGLIQFYSDNYLLFCLVSLIQSKDFRFGQNYTSTENFCSILAALGIALTFGFPLYILVLYLKKLQWIDPKHNTDCKIEGLLGEDMATEEKQKQRIELQQDHNLLLVELLQSNTHKEFMNTYGCLIGGLRLKRLGRVITVMTPLIDLLFQLLVAVSVTRLVNWPVFPIFVFNFAILFSTEFILYFSPYESRIEQIRASFNGVSYLVLNYHLFLFTEYNSTAMFPLVANSVILLVWGCIGVNLMLTFPPMLLQAIKGIKRYYFNRKLKERSKKAQIVQQQLSMFQKQQAKQAEVQFQQEILQDIENRNWEIALTRGVQDKQRLDFLESISEESKSDYSSRSQSEQSQTDLKVVNQRLYQIVQESSQVNLEQEQEQVHSPKNSQVSRGERNQVRVEGMESSNREQLSHGQESFYLQANRLRQSQPTQKQTKSKTIAVKTKPQVFQVSSRVQSSPIQTTNAQLNIITPNQLAVVQPSELAQNLDTRNMTAKAAIQKLIEQFHSIKWHKTTFHSDQNQRQPARRQQQRPNRDAFNTVIYERALASDDLIEVREFWSPENQRCFSILVNNQVYSSIQAPLDQPSDQELERQIESSVRMYQIGLHTQSDYDLVMSGKVDLKLEKYAKTYQQIKAANNPAEESKEDQADFGEYSLSLTLKQKLKMYISIVLHEKQLKKQARQNQLSEIMQ